MTDEKARLRWFFDHTSDDVKRCALAVGALYLDLIKQQPANAPATVESFNDDDVDDDAQEETNVHETPAPLVVIPKPVEPVEEKPLDTLEILPTDDDATKMRKLLARQAKERARCNNNAVQNDEDILRGKIKPDDGFLGGFTK